MRNFTDKSFRGNKTRFVPPPTPQPKKKSENNAVRETMWKSTVEPDRPQMTIWRMRIACWITKATNTLTIFNTYFSTTTMVARPHLIVTLYIHCLSGYTVVTLIQLWPFVGLNYSNNI
jgi:hypothetical protein